MAEHAARIRIGVAGWDYPDWAGVVYPPGAARGFDRLAFVARFVELVEINSTFYRPNTARTALSWLRRTESQARFRFATKAHRSWTHERDPDLDAAVPPTLDGLRPLLEAERLSALLVQFPQSFHWGEPARERLSRILERVAGWPVAVELRHVSWDRDEAAAWLRERRAGWCVVDQPRVGRSTAPARPRVTAPLAYVRLHGRNRANWFRENAGRDARYDYLYPVAELEPLADAARSMAGQAAELLVVQNNHFRGQALVNALQLRHLIEQRRPAAPESLVQVYPDLEPITTVQRERLF